MSRTVRNHPSWYWFAPEKFGRDYKPGWKPAKWYKRMRRQLERAKAKQAMREGQEPAPVKRNDMWWWN